MALKGVRPLEFAALRALDDDVGALWVAVGAVIFWGENGCGSSLRVR